MKHVKNFLIIVVPFYTFMALLIYAATWLSEVPLQWNTPYQFTLDLVELSKGPSRIEKLCGVLLIFILFAVPFLSAIHFAYLRRNKI